MKQRLLCTIGLLLVVSCSGPRTFTEDPVVWQVNDRKPIDEPEERRFSAKRYFADVLLLQRVTRGLEFGGGRHAQNTNALDEVPDSSWFTNRIGLFAYTPEEVGRGPAAGPPPQPPLVVVSGKSGGGNPGFIAQDASGRRFLIKFDTPENPEMQTATNVVVNRLFWAAGYNVPADYVFHFSMDDLTIDPDARVRGRFGRKEPLTMQRIREMLARIPRPSAGRIRATASLLLEGAPKGGFSPLGTRPDDPNDVIPHELRRELRGLRAIAAWLSHTDMKEDNTLDMWVGPEGDRHLEHYFVDFGEALGAHQAEKNRMEDGWEHVWDWERNTMAALSFGTWKRPWEDTRQTPWREIGAFAAQPFDPNLWREAYPYFPFMDANEADLYWGAKIVMRFRREHIAAVVDEAQFSNQAAAAYLVDTLVRRRDMVGRAWIANVTSLDHFWFEGNSICAIDLATHYGLANRGTVELLPRRGKRTSKQFEMSPEGKVCIPLPADDGYRIIRLRTAWNADKRPVMQLHIKTGPSPRLLGVVRKER